MPRIAGALNLNVRTESTVALIGTTRPSAVLDSDLAGAPVNVSNPPLAVLLVRDAATGSVKGFDRVVQGDLFPRFRGQDISEVSGRDDERHRHRQRLDAQGAWRSTAR